MEQNLKEENASAHANFCEVRGIDDFTGAYPKIAVNAELCISAMKPIYKIDKIAITRAIEKAVSEHVTIAVPADGAAVPGAHEK